MVFMSVFCVHVVQQAVPHFGGILTNLWVLRDCYRHTDLLRIAETRIPLKDWITLKTLTVYLDVIP